MNLKQLEALYWAARLDGFHAAARHLKTTQPGISARIRELERDLGVTLFDRSGRTARLTAKGLELVGYAEQVMQLAAEIRQRVGNRQALTGRVRLGITGVPAATWLPTLVRRLTLAYPGIALEFTVETSERMREHIVGDELDVAVLSAALPLGDRISAERVGQVPLAWLAAPALGLPAGPVTPADLAACAVITDVRASQLHEIAQAWFRAGGKAPHRHHACSNLITRVRLAAAGVGIALATPAAATRELAEGVLRLLEADPPLPALDYVIATSAARISPATRVVATLAKELIAERPGIQFYYAEAEASHRTGRKFRSD